MATDERAEENGGGGASSQRPARSGAVLPHGQRGELEFSELGWAGLLVGLPLVCLVHEVLAVAADGIAGPALLALVVLLAALRVGELGRGLRWWRDTTGRVPRELPVACGAVLLLGGTVLVIGLCAWATTGQLRFLPPTGDVPAAAIVLVGAFLLMLGIPACDAPREAAAGRHPAPARRGGDGFEFLDGDELATVVVVGLGGLLAGAVGAVVLGGPLACTVLLFAAPGLVLLWRGVRLWRATPDVLPRGGIGRRTERHRFGRGATVAHFLLMALGAGLFGWCLWQHLQGVGPVRSIGILPGLPPAFGAGFGLLLLAFALPRRVAAAAGVQR
ncbi:MAG: hypothetical protein U1E73_10780 [Planctomycetota bacterium]